jgi:hypothetical protein
MLNPHLPDSYAGDRQRPDDQYGNALGDRSSRRWDLATIVSFDAATQTYRVQAQRAGPLPNVPRLIRDPGDIAVLAAETTVAIHDELGFWVIDSVIKFAPISPVTVRTSQVTELRGVGGEDPVYAPKSDAVSYGSPEDPKDLLEGDWLRQSPDGNLVGVLAGGVNVLKSSPMSQIRTHQLQDLVEIISSTYRHLTSMGDLRIQNDGGKTSLIWRAGANQTETGANAGHWTIRLDVGATGDVFNFEVTTPEGNTLAKVHMSGDGRLELTGVSGVDITSGDRGPMREDVAGSRHTKIRGAWDLSVKGDNDLLVQGARTAEVAKNDSLTVGNDLNENVSNARNTYVGGKATEKVAGGGSVPPPVPTQVAKEIQLLNGGYLLEVGDPAKGSLPTGLQGMNFVSHVGGINFVMMPTAMPPPVGAFSVITSLPMSVLLGANGAAVKNPLTGGYTITPVAPFGVMKYEPFMAMMTALLTWLDTHVHPSAVGPTGPPAAPSSAMINPLIAPIRSVRVMVGM